MIVEFIGSTGAGKTTLINGVYHRLEMTGPVTTSNDLAASLIGLHNVTNPTLQNLAQEFVSLPFFMLTLCKHSKFLRCTVKLFWRNTHFSVQTIHNLRSLVRKIGMYEISKKFYKDKIILVDEGPILSAHMFVSTENTYTPEEIERFTGLLPLPDFVVYIRATVETLVKRTAQRIDPPRGIDLRNPRRMEEYVKRAASIFDQITQAENIRCRLIVVESLDIADPGFNQTIDTICQSILDRNRERV